MDMAPSHDVSPGSWSTWHQLDWQAIHQRVRRLQVRIAKAVNAGNWRKARKLQRLLTRSTSAKAIAVKRVTENSGRNTAGVDGETWSSPERKCMAISTLRHRGYRAKPLRRVHIPKPSGGKRPLGIPTMRDRAMQALHLLALEPYSESTGDQHSYGFRPHRAAQDAMAQCRNALSKATCAPWILEADIKGCFDNISHSWLLEMIPVERRVLQQWLKSGVIDSGKLFRTTAGTPQGGIISPVLANLVLDGMAGLLASSSKRSDKINLVRYADDFIVTGSSREVLERTRAMLVEFLAERGLSLSESKTRIVHIDEGFDFLGWNFRKYSGTLLIMPSKESQKRLYRSIAEKLRSMKTAKQESVIAELNPIIRGWANYHRSTCCSRVFAKLDHKIHEAIWRWATRRHPNKGRRWVKQRYWTRKDARDWVFTVGEMRLLRLSEFKVERHRKIQSKANPYLPEYEQYFEDRAEKQMLKKSRGKLKRIWLAQDRRCPVCSDPIHAKTRWQIHHKVWRIMGGSENEDNLVLLHINCHRKVHALGDSRWPPAWLRSKHTS